MRNKAINALIEMGMPANIKGFDYITDAMCLYAEDEIWRYKTSILYLKLAQKYKTTPSGVERCIRHAFEIVITKGYLEVVEKYLTLQNTTNGNLLSVLYFRLSREGENHAD